METATTEHVLQVLAIVEQQQSIIDQLVNLIDRSLSQHDTELAEIRDGIADLDMSKAARRQFEQLHSRVDRLEETWTKS